MKHKVTHKLLLHLKKDGYTVLYGEDQGANDIYHYTPAKWNVEEFLESTHTTSYDDHAIDIIDELLKLDEELIGMHSVNIADVF